MTVYQLLKVIKDVRIIYCYTRINKDYGYNIRVTKSEFKKVLESLPADHILKVEIVGEYWYVG